MAVNFKNKMNKKNKQLKKLQIWKIYAKKVLGDFRLKKKKLVKNMI